MERYDVVIGGGGFAGLALALALTRAMPGGFRVAVVDRTPAGGAAGADPRAFALSAASRHVLEAVGVWDRIAGEAEPVRDIEITDSALEDAIRPVLLHYDNVLSDAVPASYIVEAMVLRKALASAAATAEGVTLYAPETVSGFEPGPAGVVVTLESGESLRGALLVAADGRKSQIRAAAGIKTVGWSYGQTGIVTTLVLERPHKGRAVQHFLPAGPFAILPLASREGRHRASLVWSEDKAVAETLMELDDEFFLEEVARRFGARPLVERAGGIVALEGKRAAWPLEMHIARGFVAERVALVGDTAHGVHPLAGQGLNLAFRDVAALAEVIVETHRLGLDFGMDSVLARYERWRRFDAVTSAAAYDALNRLFSNDNPAIRMLRDAGLGLVERMPGLKRLFITEAAGLAGDPPRLLRGEAL